MKEDFKDVYESPDVLNHYIGAQIASIGMAIKAKNYKAVERVAFSLSSLLFVLNEDSKAYSFILSMFEDEKSPVHGNLKLSLKAVKDFKRAIKKPIKPNKTRH